MATTTTALLAEPVQPQRFRTDYGQRLTFGVELEFIVAYLMPGMCDRDGDNRKVYLSEPLGDYVALPIEDEGTGRLLSRGKRYRLRDVQPRDHLEGTAEFERQQYSPSGPHIRHRIAKFLRSKGIPAISDSGDAETESLILTQLTSLAESLGYENVEDMDARLDHSTLWAVETDTSVGEDFLRSYEWSSVEIKSPVLNYNTESIELVKHVVNLLNSEFRILSNESTMFHVHVGRGDKGFTMNNLRMLGSVLYAAAPRLDQLHPIHCGPLVEYAPGIRTHSLMANLSETDACRALKFKRRPKENDAFMTQPDSGIWHLHTALDDPYHGTRYSSTMRRYIPMILNAHPLLQQWKGHQRAHVFGYECLWNATDTRQFYERVGTVYQDPKSETKHYRAAYNFKNLVEEPTVKKTVEFRQHAGTMDAIAIEHWIRVAAGIVDFCVHASFHDALGPVLDRLEHRDPFSHESWVRNQPIYRQLKINVTHCLHAVGGQDYSVYDFLREIGLGVQAEWYFKRDLHPMPPDSPLIRFEEAECTPEIHRDLSGSPAGMLSYVIL